MKTIKNVLFLLVVIALTISACGKDKVGTDVKKLDREFMSSHRWKMISYTCNPAMKINNVMVTDAFANMKPCKQDDIYIFPTDSTYTELEGLTKCDVTYSDTVFTAPCVLSKDQTSILIDDFPNPVQISAIDNNKMGWEVTFIKNNISYKVNYIFEIQ